MRLMALAGALVLLVSACNSGSPPTISPATAPPVSAVPATAPPATAVVQPTAPATETATPAAAAIDWTRFDDDQVFDHATVNDVTYGNGQWLAVGNISTAGSIDAAIWTSADGETWQLVDTGDSFKSMTIAAITPFGDGYAAVGTPCGALEGCGGGGEVYVSSPDGVSWTRQPSPDVECCVMQSIAADESGLVAVGLDITTGFPATPADAGVRHSTDGVEWTQIDAPTEFATSTMGDVVAAGPGFVAVGQSSSAPQAWISTDGTEWAKAATSAAMGTGQILRAGGRDDLIVAVGRSAADAAVWTSDATGDAWSTATSPGKGSLNAVVVTPSAMVVGGKDGSDAVVWMSVDGASWSQTMTAELAADAAVGNLATDGSGTIVAFGTAADSSVVTWVGRLD